MKKLPKNNKNIISAYFYGGCIPNPGGTAIYQGVIFNNNEKIWEFNESIKNEKIATSIHVADYCGFLTILKYLYENGYFKEKIEIFTRSDLIRLQMVRSRSVYSYGINKGSYVNYALEAYDVFTKFKKLKIKWSCTDKNKAILATKQRPYVYTGILNDNLNNLIF